MSFMTDYMNYFCAKFSPNTSNTTVVLDLNSGIKGALFEETEGNKPSPVGILSSADVAGRISKEFPTYNVSTVGPTNSMEPLIDCGDLVLEVPMDLWLAKGGTYKVGQIFTYQYNSTTRIIHRLIGQRNGKYLFKGDNNKLPDYLVDPSQFRTAVVGIVYTNDKIAQNQD